MALKYRILGNSCLRVSELCLGTMTFGLQRFGTDESTAREIYLRYREAGGNFIDTANEVYGDGQSESMLGNFIQDHRDEMVIATKYTNQYPGCDPNRAGNHKKSLIQSINRSLKRLQTDYIDLLWVHAWDFLIAADELMLILQDVISAGKVLHIGISNAPAWFVARCNTIAEERGWNRFTAIQLEYSLLNRAPEIEFIPMCQNMELAFTAWSPLAMGILTGKYSINAPYNSESRRLDQSDWKTLNDDILSRSQAVVDIARQKACSPAQLSLRWLLQKGVIPVVGARNVQQLMDNLGVSTITIDDDEVVSLDALSGGSMSRANDEAKMLMYGGHYNEIIF